MGAVRPGQRSVTSCTTCTASQGRRQLTATLKSELARLKRDVRDDDQLADEQMPNGVEARWRRLRGK